MTQELMIDYVTRPWESLGGLPDRAEQDERFISQDQLDYLAGCLSDTQWLLADLEIALTKQDRFPVRPAPITDPDESPTPYRENASRATYDLSLAILGVAGVLWHRATQGQQHPFRSVAEASTWLGRNLNLLAKDQDAEQYARRISDAHDQAIAGPVEHPPCWRYLGKCEGCQADLEAQDGADEVKCECGYTERLSSVIERALASAADMLLTDTQLVGALELDGKIVSRHQVRHWGDRGRLAIHRQRRWSRSSGRIIEVKTFRLGEVRCLLADLEAKRSQNRS